MLLKIYAIKDTVVGEFMNSFELRNDEEAKRSFQMDLTHADPTKIPIQDYELYRLGERNTITGELKAELKFLMNAAEIKRGEPCNTTQTGTDQ